MNFIERDKLIKELRAELLRRRSVNMDIHFVFIGPPQPPNTSILKITDTIYKFKTKQ